MPITITGSGGISGIVSVTASSENITVFDSTGGTGGLAGIQTAGITTVFVTSVVLPGTSSGVTTVTAASSTGNNSLVLPTGSGTNRQSIITDGTGALSFVNDAGALFYRLNADLAGANVNTAQNIFGVGVTLAGSTVYGFEALYSLSKTAGTTSHTIGLGFAGTATVNNILYAASLDGQLNTVPGFDGTPQFSISNTASNFQATSTAGGSTAVMNKTFIIRGTVSINAGGTFIPQYTLSAAPGGAYSTLAGSYIRFVPIGASGSNSSQGTWA